MPAPHPTLRLVLPAATAIHGHRPEACLTMLEFLLGLTKKPEISNCQHPTSTHRIQAHAELGGGRKALSAVSVIWVGVQPALQHEVRVVLGEDDVVGAPPQRDALPAAGGRVREWRGGAGEEGVFSEYVVCCSVGGGGVCVACF